MFNATLELSNLNGINGFTIDGVASNDLSGYSVSNAGDVNGDGIDDVIIGAVTADPNGVISAGTSYVVFGQNTTFSSSFELSALDGTNGFAINGIASNDNSGWALSSAGDVNGDGIGDVIIGAFSASPGGRGQAGSSYVVFGKDTGFSPSLELSALDGDNGFAMNGVGVNDYSGFAVSGAGDMNGDGIGDVIIGAYLADPGGRLGAGASYVVFGKDTGFSAALELSTLDGSNGFAINGVATSDQSGASVSGAGDVNNDGISDVIIGAFNADPDGRISAGTSYVVFGKDTGFSASLELSELDGSDGFAINGVASGDASGCSVSAAGDMNADGIGDVIIGAQSADPDGRLGAGISYVVFGKDAEFNPVLELSTLDGDNGFAINGVASNDNSGASVSNAGDINGDGIDDVIIGAFQADPDGRNDTGTSYVVFGKDTGFSSSLELSALDGSDGFAVNGVAVGDQSGFSVSGAGDINGDGGRDVIIGAPFVVGGSDVGASYVVYGIPASAETTSTRQVSPANHLEPSVVNFLFGSHAGFFARGAEVLSSTFTAVKPILGM